MCNVGVTIVIKWTTEEKEGSNDPVQCGSSHGKNCSWCLGPFPTSDSGNKYLLIVADYFIKWTKAFPMQHQEATKVAEILAKEVVRRFGVPLSLHSDQGRNFESAVFSEMCSLLGIKKTRTIPLHPQSDGMVRGSIELLRFSYQSL